MTTSMTTATISEISDTPNRDANASSATTSRATVQATAQVAILGDRRACTALLEALYRQYHDELHGYLLHLVQDASLADDLAQQVFLHALTARRPISEVRHPHAWLYRIATNLVTDALRRRRMQTRVAPETPLQARLTDPVDEGEDLDTLLQQVEIVTSVRATLARLPTHYRVALLLYHGCDAPYEEIANQIQSSPSGVKMLLTRARRAFRASYQDATQQGTRHDGRADGREAKA